MDDTESKDVVLMDGERIESVLSLRNGLSKGYQGGSEAILLTDKRVIHLNANGQRRDSLFLSIQDVDVVEITNPREGFGVFLWSGLSLIVAIALWFVWDHPFGSPVAAVAVALMGVYVIGDRILSAGATHTTLRSGSSRLKWELKTAQASQDTYTFVNQLFQLKGDAGKEQPGRAQYFAPR